MFFAKSSALSAGVASNDFQSAVRLGETALKSICSDKMGREAFAAKIKKIRIVNTKGGYFDGCSIDGDTFVFDHAPDSNVDYGSDRVKEIQAFLENNL